MPSSVGLGAHRVIPTAPRAPTHDVPGTTTQTGRLGGRRTTETFEPKLVVPTEIPAGGTISKSTQLGRLQVLHKTDYERTAAKLAIDARVQQGGFQAPLGEGKELGLIGGAWAVRYSGGSNHALGSVIVYDPVHKAAHHITNGMAAAYLSPREELGGRIAADALGYPLGAEYPDDQGVWYQRFQHGTLVWDNGGARFDPPDLLEKRRGALPPIPPKEFLTPVPYDGTCHESFFIVWVDAQVKKNEHIRATYEHVKALVTSEGKPTTVTELLERVRAFAATQLPVDPRVDPATRAHLVNVTALIGLTGVSLRNDGSDKVFMRAFPAFMGDGRSCDGASDKAWHFTNQAMMAYVLRFCDEVADPAVGHGLRQTVIDTGKEEYAAKIAETYHARRGALGSFVGQALQGPPDERGGPYAPRPIGLSAKAQAAFDLAVRIGDVHEYVSSSDFFTVTVDDIGDDAPRWDPLAQIHARWDRVWGLQDPGVVRDLTANRLGARFGVEWFDAPDKPPHIPYDHGKSEAWGGYAASKKIPYDLHLGEELMMLEALGSGSPGSAQKLAAAAKTLKAMSCVAATQLVRAKLAQAIDHLTASGDHERLARYYGNYCIRHQRWGERLPNFAVDQSYFAPAAETHTQWAAYCLTQKLPDLKAAFLSRFDEAAQGFG